MDHPALILCESASPSLSPCFDSANEGAFKAAFMNYMLKERKGVLTFTQEELRHVSVEGDNYIVNSEYLTSSLIFATHKNCVGSNIGDIFASFPE